MKGIIAGLVVLGLVQGVQARPLYDFIIGGAMLATGVTFELQRANAKSEKETAQKNADASASAGATAALNAVYYQGAADWEFVNFGNTSQYRSLSATAVNYSITATRNLNQAVEQSNSASSKRDDENLYKGISLVSFAVGSAFIIKGTISLFLNRSGKMANSHRFQWVKNVDLHPNPNMDGAVLKYTYKL